MGESLARAIFPFRVFAFCGLYVTINIVLWTLRSDYTGPANFLTNYYQNKIDSAISSPNVAPSVKDAVRNNIGNSQIVRDAKYSIRIWLIFGDIFIVLLFVALILGFNTVSAQMSFIEGFLHFIGLILITHAILSNASPDYVICAVFFGTLLPFVMELWQVFALFVLKTDFY